MPLVFDDEQSVTSPKLVFDDEQEPKTPYGFGKNIVQDVGGLIKGTYEAGKQLAPFAGKTAIHGVQSLAGMLAGQPVTETPSYEDAKTIGKTSLNMGKGLLQEGKRIGGGQLLTGHPIEAGKQFLEAAYQKPVTTALDVLPFASAAGKTLGFGGKATEATTQVGRTAELETPLAEDLGRIAPTAPKPVGIAPEAGDILKNIKPPEAPPPSPPHQGVIEPLKEVQDYLLNKYGDVSSKPGFANTMGEILSRKAKAMRLKELGMSPGQARKLVERFGEEKLMELSDIAKEKGITKPIAGYKIGQNIQELHDVSGKMIGKMREAASSRGAVHDPNLLIQSIKQELDPKYLGKGVDSGQKGIYLKALEDIRQHASTPDKLANKLTDMNDYATANKLTQATGAISDVANTASRANNNLMRQFLKPEEMEAYTEALKDFGVSKLFKKFYGFRVGRSMAGRSGPSAIINWARDAFGNKFIENISEGLGNKLKSNPGMTKNPKVFMDEILKQMSDTLDEIGDEFVQ